MLIIIIHTHIWQQNPCHSKYGENRNDVASCHWTIMHIHCIEILCKLNYTYTFECKTWIYLYNIKNVVRQKNIEIIIWWDNNLCLIKGSLFQNFLWENKHKFDSQSVWHKILATLQLEYSFILLLKLKKVKVMN